MKEVAAAIIHDKNRILICQRAEDEYNNLWEFPGGKREKGETLEECIVREIQEELDLKIEVFGVFTTTIYNFNGGEIFFTVFDAAIIEGELRLNVHRAAEWVTVNELNCYEFMPADVQFVEKLVMG